MRYLAPFVVLVMLAACNSESRFTPATAPSTPVSAFFTLEDDAAFTYGNLKIYPIRATEAYDREYSSLGNYMTLASAVKSNKVKVKEHDEEREERARESQNNLLGPGPGGMNAIVPDGQRQQRQDPNDPAQVNGLIIHNTSEDTVFVMAGEVVEGGKQNRVIASDFILRPREKKDIAVFCVEQGRWTAREGGNVFNNVFGVTAPAVRKQALKHKSQSGVWQEVSNTLSTYAADNETGAYTGLKDSEEFKSGVGAYVSHYKEKLGDDDIVGFVAVSGDEIVGMEIFYRHSLFEQQLEALVSSYATGATATPAVSGEAVQAYFNEQLDRYDDYETVVDTENDYQMLTHRKRVIHYMTF